MATIEVGTGSVNIYKYVGLKLDGFPPVAAINTVYPVTGGLSLAGIAPSLKGTVQPSTASLTIDEQTPTSDYVAQVSPSTVGVSLSSDAPTAVQAHVYIPDTVAVTLAGKIPLRSVDASGSSVRTPITVALALDGQSVDRVDYSPVDPLGVSLSLSGTTPTIDVAKAVLTQTGSLQLTSIPIPAEGVSSGTPIVNPGADDSIISNVEECDLTGFKQMPGSMKLQWNKYAVRGRSFDQRNPADVPHRTHPQRKRGPQRPEPDDTFLDTDVSPEDY